MIIVDEMAGRGGSHPCLSHELKREIHDLAADHLEMREQNDGTQQGHQHGGKGDRIIDRADPQQRGDEVTSQEGANDAHHDIEKQALLSNSYA